MVEEGESWVTQIPGEPAESGFLRLEHRLRLSCAPQIAYLENLLKVYNEEIRRLQEKEMSLDDLEAEDSGYIQEDKLKHKVRRCRAGGE